MGWLFNQSDSLPDYRDSLQKELRRGWEIKGVDGEIKGYCRAIKSTSKGFRGLGRIWSLFEIEDAEGKPIDYCISLHLLGSHRDQGELWCGYKDICLSMGPNEDDCPVGYVKAMLRRIFQYDTPNAPLRKLCVYEIDWLLNFAEKHPSVRALVKDCVTFSAQMA